MSQIPRPGGASAASDTTSFKVGDVVYVGGQKKGKIAFLGQCKFAQGDWAGVELDQAEGKNDGSVQGVRYFQCAPNHGVFSRATRLSRQPGENPAMTSSTVSSLASASTVASTARVAANRKTPPRSMARANVESGGGGRASGTPSPTGSTTSLASTTCGPPKIGDRVIVSSTTGGSKTGTLRFLGQTE